MTGLVALFGEVLADVFPDRSVLGGAPFNVARHLQMFGLHPTLVTRTGNDALAKALHTEMARLGMDASGVQCDPVHPTGRVMVHMQETGHHFEILPDQAYDHIQADAVSAAAASADMVYFGTLAQRHPQSRQALDAFLEAGSSPRFLDINLRKPWYAPETIRRALRRADILKINDEELAILAALFDLPGQARQHAAALVAAFALDRVLVTCGAEGAWLLDSTGKEIRVPGKSAAPLADTVGAGDGFAAVYILGTLLRWEMETTLNRANDFAASICAIRGAVPDQDDFYAPFLRKWKL